MPGYNQTGPSGRGPMTGRGRGFCRTDRPVDETAIADNAGVYGGMGFGRGFRRGPGAEMRGYMGRGPGRRRAAWLDAYPEETHVTVEMLKGQAESIKHALDTINQRLSKLEKSE